MVVNAGFDSMGGVTDGGVEISSAPSQQQSSNLEKTQAELRETFSAAEKFRRELEFLQKGGDPLDLKPGNAASASLQSTSLLDQHPGQLLTSEVKGSFAITASPNGDSVESSGRLGAPSVGEPNSADNLMLFDGDNKFREVEKRSLHPRMNNTNPSDVALEFPKKSYKRRNRSRPNRDGPRSSSTDAGPRSGQPFLTSRHASRDSKGLEHATDNQEHKYFSNSNSKPKSPVAHKSLVSNSWLDVKLNGNQTQKSTLGPAYGPSDQPLTSDTLETPLFMCSGEQETLPCSAHPPNMDTETVTKGFSKSSCSQANQSVYGVNENESLAITRTVSSNGTVELNLASKSSVSMEGNDVKTIKDERKFNLATDNCNPYPASHNDNSSTLKEEEGLKGSEPETVCSQDNLKLATKEHEDSILEEARIIEEKRKRIAGLSIGILSSESHHRSHWHFVLEEMSWLANDFAQERLWKANIAAQISRRAAYNSRVRYQQQTSLWKQKEVAHTLAEAVMEFWQTMQVKCNGLELTGSEKDTKLGLHEYGIRFLEYNNIHAQYSSAQAPMTPDRISDFGIIDISWEDNLTEENLFYTVPPGAIEAYRRSIESHLVQCERTGSSMQEEVDASGYDAVTDDALEEDEGETSTYYLPGAFEGSRSSKPTQKRTTHFRSYGPRPYETGHDLSTDERNFGTQPSVLSGKRPNITINVSIPTKRVRTASRPRFIGTSGFISRAAGASSGDTNSFQDEQSSLHGGSQIPNNMEVELVGDDEKQLHFDLTEVSNRPKKKKKIEHPGSMFDHRWQLDSNFHSDQKDHSKRRLDTRQFDSNGNTVASHTSNMSNPNKIMKLLVRDRGGRKANKSLKTPGVQQGSGSPWSLFEDQALVVLVHDMGANWELISDAINSTLQFKCISRNSKECKERHKYLMDRNTGDGADSAEDSGSSQPYPSTLPGIPEGSARQLFQRLQGPMEEDTLKSHFEKIILIWQKQHYRKAQKDNQDPKQLQQPHGSHALALSQVCPNNLNGGAVLTPLDLCDAISPSPDFVPVGYHTGGVPIQNHGNVAAMVPPASSLPGSSSAMGLGSHLASASAPLSPSVRDARYGIPRAGSLSITDEQQQQHSRIQQLSQMSAARNTQQSGTDRLLPGGNGMNRRSVPRPTFHSAPGQGNLVRPRDALHLTRLPNQNSEHLQRQIMAPDLPVVSQGGMASFSNLSTQQQQQQPQPPILQSFPHPHHHLQGPSNHHPPYGVRFLKERQLHQQRLLQQQFPTSNPVMPHVQPPQLTVSSPQTSSTQIQSHSSSPLSHPPMAQKRPIPTPHGLPQTGVNQSPCQFQQTARQHPTQQVPKVIKGGGGRGTINQNIGTDSSLVNGFVGGPSGAASKQSMPHSPLNQSQQKRYPSQPLAASSSKQIQPQKPSLLSDTNSNNHAPSSSNHRQPQPPQKLVNQIQVTPAQRIIHNRKESPTSKLQAREAAQTSEPFYDSSGAAEVPTGGGEDSGPVGNHGDGVHKQSSSDILPNSVGHGDAAGVQWQQQSSS